MWNDNETKQKRIQAKPPEQGTKPAELRKITPKIDLRICEKSYHCVSFCPRNAISLNQKRLPAIDYDLCDGCLICLRECPSSAINEQSSGQALEGRIKGEVQ